MGGSSCVPGTSLQFGDPMPISGIMPRTAEMTSGLVFDDKPIAMQIRSTARGAAQSRSGSAGSTQVLGSWVSQYFCLALLRKCGDAAARGRD